MLYYTRYSRSEVTFDGKYKLVFKVYDSFFSLLAKAFGT